MSGIPINIIQPDGSSERIELDRDPTLADYYGWIGCDMIEVIRCSILSHHDHEMILDEEGKCKSILETNAVACAFAGVPFVGDYRIVGVAVVQPAGTLK